MTDVFPFLPWLCAGGLLALWAFLLAGSASARAFVAGATLLAAGSAFLLLYAVSHRYTGEGFNDAALYHLQKGIAGLTWALLAPWLALGALVAGAGLLLGGLAAWKTHGRARQGRPTRWGWLLLGAPLALGANPGLLQAGQMGWRLLEQPRHAADLARRTVPVPPQPVAVPGAGRPNLVLIYAEGLERAFLEPDRFPGLTPRLNALRSRAMDVAGLRQAPFTGWTMAGQVATQCGVPVGNGQDGRGLESHPCLGDLLARRGYTLSYLNGSKLEFAGKGAFWAHHGYTRLHAHDDVRRLAGSPEAPVSEWGPYDDTLLAAARAEMAALERLGTPFSLTLLTVDTHAPNGYPTPACKGRHYREGPARAAAVPLLDAVHCADRLLGAFVEELLARNDPNLVVVLVSDHLQPKANGAEAWMPARLARDNLFLVWRHGMEGHRVDRPASTFDAYPTLAELLGMDLPAAGLGRSLQRPAPTLTEALGQTGFFARIQSAYTLDSEGFWTQRDAPPVSPISPPP